MEGARQSSQHACLLAAPSGRASERAAIQPARNDCQASVCSTLLLTASRAAHGGRLARNHLRAFEASFDIDLPFVPAVGFLQQSPVAASTGVCEGALSSAWQSSPPSLCLPSDRRKALCVSRPASWPVGSLTAPTVCPDQSLLRPSWEARWRLLQPTVELSSLTTAEPFV